MMFDSNYNRQACYCFYVYTLDIMLNYSVYIMCFFSRSGTDGANYTVIKLSVSSPT